MLKTTPAQHGLLLIDKPAGITSQGVVKKLKWLTKIKKVGHTGTLDPMATGLLPVCLGEATKFSQFLLDSVKTYEATLKLGAQTDTGDAQGQIIRTQATPLLSEASIVRAMQNLSGEIMQVPPMYAAIKVNGKKLYEYAREGIAVERAARPVRIEAFELIQLSQDQSGALISFQARVSKGTYIRTLAEDLAAALGALGHLVSLRRTATSCFTIDQAHDLKALENAPQVQLLPSDAGLSHLRLVRLDEAQIERLRIGQRLNIHEMVRKPKLEWIRVGSQREAFSGLCELAADGRLQPKRMMHLGD